MADAKMLGKERVLAKIRAIPQYVQETGEVALDAGTDELVATLQRAAPVASRFERKDRPPGQLRASIHKYRNPDRPLSWRIIADARDRAGLLFGVWVEFGHGDAAPEPFWYPTYRAWKKPFRTKLFADVRRSLNALWGK